MSELKKNFVQGKMNKDYDVRLVPEGEYIDAFNVLVSNSEGSQVGSVQNSFGLDKLSNINLPNDAETIGSCSDEGGEKIYWFVATNNGSSYIFEYDQLNNGVISTVLEDTRTAPNNVLNFNKQNKITGANVIYNSFNRQTLLVWTDDLNPIRCINVTRAKSYGPASNANNTFLTQDISLYKRQPHFAPICTPTTTGDGVENNMKERFLSFGYRWKYKDGEYSSISTFSNPQFYPGKFSLDYTTNENIGMVNKFNAVNIKFNTGDKNVTDIQLVFKESNSNTVWIIDNFNKKDRYWLSDVEKSFNFANNKIYSVLPEDEINRLFDNVPIVAKAQEFIGNRLIYGNYVEGRNMLDKNGIPINVNYTLTSISEDLKNVKLAVEVKTNTENIDGVNTPVQNSFVMDFTGKQINKGDVINFNFIANSPTSPINYRGIYNCSLSLFLENSYSNAYALQQSLEFGNFLNVIAYNDFKNYDTRSNTPANEVPSYPDKYKPFFVISQPNQNKIEIKIPYIEYKIENPVGVFSYKEEYFSLKESSVAILLSSGNAFSSCKSNRSYESGIIYMDEEGRYSTVITNSHSNSVNNCFIPISKSTNKNTLQMSVRHKAPYWATKYKVFVKDNKLDYQTIYGNILYKDDNYSWLKLEGQDKNKVEDGDFLTIKRDLYGPTTTLNKLQVLEYKQQPKDFISTGVGTNTIGLAGNYIKLKNYSGIDIDSSDNNTIILTSHAESYSGAHTFYSATSLSEFTAPSTYVDIPITAGTVISVRMTNQRSDTGQYLFEKKIIASQNYMNFEDWFLTEIGVDAGDFDVDFDRGYIETSRFGVKRFVPNPAGGLVMLVWNIVGGLGGEVFSGRPSYIDVEVRIDKSLGTIILETEPKDKLSQVYYETSDTYLIDSNGNHLSISKVGDTPISGNVNQNGSTTPATLNLSFFNCYTQGNGAESYVIKDLFNANFLSTNTRPNAVQLDGYKSRRNISSLTYSGAFEKTTSYNSLNEFNLSRANYKDLDDKYGSIQKLFSRDTDLIVFQEDKIHKVLYNKNLLSDAVGGGQITSVEQVLGQEVPFVGEWGIGKNPESFSNYANNLYFTDQPKGVVLRLGNDGLEVISRYGMKDWFRDNLRDYSSKFVIGGYDPSYDNYIIGFTDEVKQLGPLYVGCNQEISKLVIPANDSVSYKINVGNKVGDYVLNYDVYQGVITIDITIGEDVYSYEGVDSNDSISIPKENTIEEILVTFSNFTNNNAEISFSNDCPETPELEVITLVVNDLGDATKSMKNQYTWTDPTYGYSGGSYDTDVFEMGGLTRFRTEVGMESDGAIPFEGSTVRVSSIKINGQFTTCNRLGYIITSSNLDAAQVLASATYPAITTIGDEKYFQFTYTRSNLNQKLYIVWDYIDSVYADTTSRLQSINLGGTFTIDALNTVTVSSPYSISIVTSATKGTTNITGNNITYLHNGVNYESDFFIYRISKTGGCYIDVRVDILVNQAVDGIPCYEYTIFTYYGEYQEIDYIDCFGIYQTAVADGTEGGMDLSTSFCAREIIGTSSFVTGGSVLC